MLGAGQPTAVRRVEAVALREKVLERPGLGREEVADAAVVRAERAGFILIEAGGRTSQANVAQARHGALDQRDGHRLVKAAGRIGIDGPPVTQIGHSTEDPYTKDPNTKDPYTKEQKP